MKRDWYKILPWTALASGVLLVVLVATAIIFKPAKNSSTTVNRKAAYDKLKLLKVAQGESISSTSFCNYFENVLKSSPINTRWLIDNTGIIVYANGMMSQSTPLNSSVFNLKDDRSLGLLDAVDENLDPLQKEILYIAAAIRSEGEHNDILGHIVMPLKTDSGETAGFAGVAYELDDAARPAFFFITGIAMFICFAIYWLSLPAYVFYDAKNRNEKHVLWTLFVLIGNLPAFIAYLLVSK